MKCSNNVTRGASLQLNGTNLYSDNFCLHVMDLCHCWNFQVHDNLLLNCSLVLKATCISSCRGELSNNWMLSYKPDELTVSELICNYTQIFSRRAHCPSSCSVRSSLAICLSLLLSSALDNHNRGLLFADPWRVCGGCDGKVSLCLQCLPTNTQVCGALIGISGWATWWRVFWN